MPRQAVVEEDPQVIDVHGRKFHLAWLRYSCPCPQCRHPESFQKTADLSSRPGLPEAESVALDPAADELRIVWREEPVRHHSTYPLDWLLLYSAGGPDSGAESGPETVLWDAETLRGRACAGTRRPRATATAARGSKICKASGSPS